MWSTLPAKSCFSPTLPMKYRAMSLRKSLFVTTLLLWQATHAKQVVRPAALLQQRGQELEHVLRLAGQLPQGQLLLGLALSDAPVL